MVMKLSNIVLGWQGMAVTAAASAIIAFGAGWGVNGWRLDGKAAKAKTERLEASLKSAQDSARLAREGQAQAKSLNETLRGTLSTLQGTVGVLSDANGALAQSRAPRVQTIIKEAQSYADQNYQPDACPRQLVDDGMLDFIWPPAAPVIAAGAAPVRLGTAADPAKTG